MGTVRCPFFREVMLLCVVVMTSGLRPNTHGRVLLATHVSGAHVPVPQGAREPAAVPAAWVPALRSSGAHLPGGLVGAGGGLQQGCKTLIDDGRGLVRAGLLLCDLCQWHLPSHACGLTEPAEGGGQCAEWWQAGTAETDRWIPCSTRRGDGWCLFPFES